MKVTDMVAALLKALEVDKFYKRSTAIHRLDTLNVDGRTVIDTAEGLGWLDYYPDRDEVVISGFSWMPVWR